MAQLFVVLAGIGGFLAVALGAFGAHALKARLTPELLHAFQTGVEYQFYHSLALLAVALLMYKYPLSALWVWSGSLFVAGIVLFSGSLYLLATLGWRWLGPVTPIGGLCFLLGWFCLILAAWRGME